MNLNAPQKICLTFFAFLLVFWVALFIYGSKNGFFNYLYSLAYGLVPFIGGAVAMKQAQLWGEWKNVTRKAVLFIGTGLFLWGCGDIIWAYYNFFLDVSAPYPSLADIGFAPSIFFYALGSIYLAKATGIKLSFRSGYGRAFALAATIAVFIASYYILVVIARDGVLISSEESLLKIILDIAYPLGDFVGLTTALVVSGLAFRHLKGKYKFDIIAVLAGLAVMFVGDSIFSYTTTVGTFYNGSVGDLALATGMFLLTFGVLGFYTPHPSQPSLSALGIYGNNVVLTSAADDFAVVVRNKKLAEELKKAFGAGLQWLVNKVRPFGI